MFRAICTRKKRVEKLFILRLKSLLKHICYRVFKWCEILVRISTDIILFNACCVSLICFRHAVTTEIVKGGAGECKIILMWVLRIWIHVTTRNQNSWQQIHYCFLDILILNSFKMLCLIQMFNMCYAKWRQEKRGILFIFIIMINASEAVIIPVFLLSIVWQQIHKSLLFSFVSRPDTKMHVSSYWVD